MKKLLISSNNDCFCDVSFGLNCEPPVILSENLEVDVKRVRSASVDLIILPLEQSAEYLTSYLFGGLEFLLWLRIKGINTHVLVLSFFSLQEIMSKTKQAFILGSKGITFVQIPFHHLDEKRLNRMAGEYSDENNLKSYLASIFDLVHFRHAYANVWGLQQIVKVHKTLNTSFDESVITYDKDISLSLNYKIGEYLYGHSDNSVNPEIFCKIIKLNESIKSFSLKPEYQNKKILVIDDKADAGWISLLKDIFPSCIDIISVPIGCTYKELEDNFISYYNDYDCLMVLLDLRLRKTDDEIHDYASLDSMILMKKMLAAPNNPDKRNKYRNFFTYKKLKFILFTASNQLHNLLEAINENEYIPHTIFIKEGFDINQDKKSQQAYNYTRLLKVLESTLKAKRNNPKRIEAYISSDQKEIDIFEAGVFCGIWQPRIKQLYDQYLSRYTHIILDTNIFADEFPLIPLCKDANIIMLYPVFKELERWTKSRDQGYKKYCAEYFLSIVRCR